MAANGILRMLVDSSHTSGPCTARVVKYIAKSAAKNINSEESQTMVPTATRFGRLTLCELKVLEDMGELSRKTRLNSHLGR